MSNVENLGSLSCQLDTARLSQDLSASGGAIGGAFEANGRSLRNLQAASDELQVKEGKLGRLLSKKATRVKEMLLQNFGKSDKTTDSLFQVYEQNFLKQQAQATKLSKEFKLHLIALKGAQEAARSLHECVQESTSDNHQSARHDLVCENLSQLEHLHEDYLEKMREQVSAGLVDCLANFGELRQKVAKRHRKLLDYDSSRRLYEQMLATVNKRRVQAQLAESQHSSDQTSSTCNLPDQHQGRQLGRWNMLAGVGMSRQGSLTANCSQSVAVNQGSSIQRAASQLVDEARLAKLREQYNYAKLMYETINSELHEELPTIYERKLRSLLLLVQGYFALQAQYHWEASKLFGSSAHTIDELPEVSAGSLASSSQVHLALGGSCEQVSTRLVHDYNKAASSSGMGSSRGESASSSSASSGNRSPEEAHCAALDETIDQECEQDAEEFELKKEEKVAEVDASESNQQVEDVEDQGNVEAPEESTSGPNVGSVGLEPSFTVEVAGAILDAAEKSFSIEKPDEHEDKLEQQEVETAAKGQFASKPQDEVAEVVQESPSSEESASKDKASRPLYKVRTLYKYMAEDVDELCFEADEIVQVVEFEPNQDQEEGWLLGIREVNGQKGLFPANFTRSLEATE